VGGESEEYHEEVGMTLKEFEEEINKLGMTIKEGDNLDWHILYHGCEMAVIDPVTECRMSTMKYVRPFDLEWKLYILLSDLAGTCLYDRHLEDYFEEWQYEE
jgi:hypothetical protein